MACAIDRPIERTKIDSIFRKRDNGREILHPFGRDNMKKWLILGGGFTFLAFIFLMFLGNIVIWSKFVQPSLDKNRTEMRQYFSDAKQDQLVLMRDNPFRDLYKKNSNRSATLFLDDRIPWKAGDKAELSLPQGLIELMKKSKADWLNLSGKKLGAKLDFAWLANLKDYDHWSLWDSAQVKDLLKKPTYTLLDAPTPHYPALIAWGKLRMLSSIKTGDSMQAAVEIRHLARLVTSQETLLATLVARTILRNERQFYKRFHASIPNLPMPVSKEFLVSSRRLPWYLQSAIGPDSDPKVFARFSKASSELFGWCGVLSEVTTRNEMWLDAPKQIRSGVVAMAKRRRNSKCRFQKFYGKRKSPSIDEVLEGISRQSPEGLDRNTVETRSYIMKVPIISRTIYGILFAIGSSSSWVHLYEKKQNPAQ